MNKEDMIKKCTSLTNMSVNLVYRWHNLVYRLLLHYVAGEGLSCDKGKIKETELLLPKMGVLKVKFISVQKREYTFIPNKEFDRDLLHIWKTGESPLLELLESDVVDKIEDKYNGLF